MSCFVLNKDSRKEKEVKYKCNFTLCSQDVLLILLDAETLKCNSVSPITFLVNDTGEKKFRQVNFQQYGKLFPWENENAYAKIAVNRKRKEEKNGENLLTPKSVSNNKVVLLHEKVDLNCLNTYLGSC